MILYFSGTGNSLWVAGRLSQALGQAKPVSVADELRRHAGDAVLCRLHLRGYLRLDGPDTRGGFEKASSAPYRLLVGADAEQLHTDEGFRSGSRRCA